MRPTFYRIGAREIAMISVPVLALLGAALWFTLHFAQPAPPSRIVITTGGEAGAYYGFGKRYAEILKRSGITLEVRPSAGSIENLKRLLAPKSDVHLALLQGGIANQGSAAGMVSLGRIFYEPLWVFYRGADTLDRLSQLKGKRIAVGAEGSGTRHLAESLLKPNGVTAGSATLLAITGRPAVEALLNGDADAIMLALAPEAPLLQEVLRTPEARLMSLTQSEALTRLFPYLTRVTLPAGVFDLARNIPAQEVLLVAPVAVLLAREDLHPALVFLLSQALKEVHGGPSLFQHAGEFPKAADPEFPVSDHALRYYRNGAPFLQRFLPFWLANFLERLVVLAVPILTVAIPLFKVIPWLYRWRVRERMLYWYALLKKVEASLDEQPTLGQLGLLKSEIDRIEDDVNDSPVPLGFSEQFYNLRGHIDLVRGRLTTKEAGLGALVGRPA